MENPSSAVVHPGEDKKRRIRAIWGEWQGHRSQPGSAWRWRAGGGWQGQGRATHILHLITLPDTLESGVRPHSLQTSEKKGLRGKVSGGWLMVITTKRLVSEESCKSAWEVNHLGS